MASEATEPGSESGKRSDDRRGVPEGTPQEGGASTPLAAPGSVAAAGMVARTASCLELIVNDEPRQLPDGATVAELVAALGLGPRRIAVEVNLAIVPRADYA